MGDEVKKNKGMSGATRIMNVDGQRFDDRCEKIDGSAMTELEPQRGSPEPKFFPEELEEELFIGGKKRRRPRRKKEKSGRADARLGYICLLYTSDAADE